MRAAIRFSSQNLPRFSSLFSSQSLPRFSRLISEKTNPQNLQTFILPQSRSYSTVFSVNHTKKPQQLGPMTQYCPFRTIMIPVGDLEEFDLKTIDPPVPEDKKNTKVREKVFKLAIEQKLYTGKRKEILKGTDVVGLIETCYPLILSQNEIHLERLSEFMQILFANDDDADIQHSGSNKYIETIIKQNEAMIAALKNESPSKIFPRVQAIIEFREKYPDFCNDTDLQEEFNNYLQAVVCEKLYDLRLEVGKLSVEEYVSAGSKDTLKYVRPEASGAVLAQMMAITSMKTNGIITHDFTYYSKKYRILKALIDTSAKHIGFFNDVVSYKKEAEDGIALFNAVEQTRASILWKRDPIGSLKTILGKRIGYTEAKTQVLRECNDLYDFFKTHKRILLETCEQRDREDLEQIISCLETWFAQPWWAKSIKRYN